MKALTEKSLSTLEFLKRVEGDITLEQVAEALNVDAKSVMVLL